MPNPENVKPFEFKKGQITNPDGRPKSIASRLKELGYLGHNEKLLTRSQIEELIRLTLSKTKAELTEMAKDPNVPYWITLIANAAAKNAQKGTIDILGFSLDRTIGKATTPIELSGKDGKPIEFNSLHITEEEVEKRILEMIEKKEKKIEEIPEAESTPATEVYTESDQT